MHSTSYERFLSFWLALILSRFSANSSLVSKCCRRCSFPAMLNSDDKLDDASPFKTSNTRSIQFGKSQCALRRAVEQFKHGIDWTGRPQLAHNLIWHMHCASNSGEGHWKKRKRHRSWELLLGIRDGGVPPGSSNPDPISDHWNVIFHTRFQTWPLGRNYFIIT